MSASALTRDALTIEQRAAAAARIKASSPVRVEDLDAALKGVLDVWLGHHRALETKIGALEARLAGAEAGTLKYFGVWQPGTYRKGAAVTHQGSLWIAQEATSARPGEAHPESRAWQLAAKRGAAGRDARDR